MEKKNLKLTNISMSNVRAVEFIVTYDTCVAITNMS